MPIDLLGTVQHILFDLLRKSDKMDVRSFNEGMMKPDSITVAARRISKPELVDQVCGIFDQLDFYVQTVLIISVLTMTEEQFNAIKESYANLIACGERSMDEWVRKTSELFKNYPNLTQTPSFSPTDLPLIHSMQAIDPFVPKEKIDHPKFSQHFSTKLQVPYKPSSENVTMPKEEQRDKTSSLNQRPPMGRPIPPMGQQMPPTGQHLPSMGMLVHQNGQPNSKIIPPMGQQMPPMGQQIPPMCQQIPPMGQQMPPMGAPITKQIPPMGQTIPPMGQQVPPMGQPPMNQQVPPMGQAIPPMGQRLPPMGAQQQQARPPQSVHRLPPPPPKEPPRPIPPPNPRPEEKKKNKKNKKIVQF